MLDETTDQGVPGSNRGFPDLNKQALVLGLATL